MAMMMIILLSLSIRVLGASLCLLAKQRLYALLSCFMWNSVLPPSTPCNQDPATVISHTQAQLAAYGVQRGGDQPNHFVIPRIDHGRLYQQGVQAVQVSATLTRYL